MPKNVFLARSASFLVMLLPFVTIHAQAPDSTVFVRAQQMVSNGDASAGRALVDSMLNAATSGSPQYAEALYWRATLAPTAADAERDYRRIVVDYSLSSRVDDALLRMGQLELTRGDRDAALLHFQRLTLEHPDSPLRAKASYWTARALFEKNDISHACAANAEALARVRPSDVELRNQIDFQQQRCRGVAVATTPAAAPAMKPEPAVEPAATKPAVSKPAPKAVASAKPTVKSAAKSTARKAAAAKPAPEPAAAAETPEHDTAAPATAPAATSETYMVQVAAYYDRSQADAMAAKLSGRGYKAHVDGTTAPFRVRIGHFATRAQAATLLSQLKAKKIDGFITKG